MYVVGIDPTVVSTSPEFGLGQLGLTNDGKIYKYVLYENGTANLTLAIGDVVYYVDVTGYGTSTVSADVSDSTGKEIGAGVVPAVVADDASYFWVQIKGAATILVALGGSAGDGEPLTATAAADKGLTLATEGAGVLAHVCAIAMDASAKTIVCDFPF